MEHVHLAADEEDDLYSGYNGYTQTFDSEMTAQFPGIDIGGRALGTSFGDGAARPMTAVRAAGYSSAMTRGEFTREGD
ncbi:unnamed protein product, partial [Coregonus sp. 'balchen']